MHVCLITTTLPPVTGGLETHVWELARALSRRGHRVSLIGSRNYRGRSFPAGEEQDGVRIWRVPDRVLPLPYVRYRLFPLPAAALARRLHRDNPLDIVHAHQSYPAGVAGALLKKRLGLPLVISCHGTALFQNWEVGRLRVLMKWSLMKADRVVAVGGELKEKLISGGVAPGRIDVQPNLVDTETFSPGAGGGEVRRKFGWEADEVVVAYVGRLHPAKGPRHFIRAAEAVLKEGMRLKFLVVGGGELEAELRSEADRGGHREAFVFTGEVPHAAIPAYLAAADILAVPSLAEGGGLACLEGMAMGKAVVANRVGGLAEVIDDGRTGLLVSPGIPGPARRGGQPGKGHFEAFTDAVRRVAAEPGLRRRLGAEARRQIEEQYSWEAGLKRLLTVYERARQKI